MKGTTDPEVLAELARGRMRAKLPALRQALAGRFRSHRAFLLTQLLAHLDYVDELTETVSAKIDEVIAPFAEEATRLDHLNRSGQLGVPWRVDVRQQLLHGSRD